MKKGNYFASHKLCSETVLGMESLLLEQWLAVSIGCCGFESLSDGGQTAATRNEKLSLLSDLHPQLKSNFAKDPPLMFYFAKDTTI